MGRIGRKPETRHQQTATTPEMQNQLAETMSTRRRKELVSRSRYPGRAAGRRWNCLPRHSCRYNHITLEKGESILTRLYISFLFYCYHAPCLREPCLGKPGSYLEEEK
ncbi:hypothetical protein NDU88_001488 [Pleurodeles waltl]|uniref:Uncharacterized protein n=1 Tax=Pleurodeles waltl TaxID=8319 RepID=A0AAV7TJ06_PLEWA|nr:hypothetical protein NDU88_001488 [Pleurodeles waltl]